MPSSSEQRELEQLAEAAGLAVHWKNYRGEDRTVAPDTLRAVLGGLEIECGSAAQCRESRRALEEERQNHCPPLLIGRCGESLTIPGMAASTRVVLLGENGGRAEQELLPDAGGARLTIPESPGYYQLETGDHRFSLAAAPGRCTTLSDLGVSRGWGPTVQLYSLRRPGDGGMGDFSALRDFAGQMARAGADAIAVSPVHAQFSADLNRYSPYSPSSRLFLNALYIDPRQLFADDAVLACLRARGLEQAHAQLQHLDLIDWPEAGRVKLAVLRCLWEESHAELMDTNTPLAREFAAYRREAGETLELHAVFEALHAWQYGQHGRWHWRDWPAVYRDHNGPAVRRFAEEQRHEVMFHCFLQWLADRGLAEAQARGCGQGARVGLVADLAVGTDSGGSHAWSRKEDKLAGLSVGAPPDLLNHHGQDWGLTTFSPRALRAHGYGPFLEMLRASLRHAGGLRIDHILGLRRLWLVPEGGGPDEGAYLHFPQAEMLNLVALESQRHRALIVGEDLGTVPGNFREEMGEAGLLGMAVLWFEKDHGFYMDPSRWRPGALATTTTHDLPTVAGWWRGRDIHWNDSLNRLPEGRSRDDMEAERAGERRALWAAFQHAGVNGDDEPPPEDTETVVDAALAFVARPPGPLTLAPVEDLLGLEEQPNLPGTLEEHPNWRRRLPYSVASLESREELRRRCTVLRSNRAQSEGRQE